MGIDARKGVGEVDDIGRWLGTFRESCSGRRGRGNIEVRVEVPDYEHLVICRAVQDGTPRGIEMSITDIGILLSSGVG